MRNEWKKNGVHLAWDFRNYDKRPRLRVRVPPVCHECAPQGLLTKAQKGAWCRGLCHHHAVANGLKDPRKPRKKEPKRKHKKLGVKAKKEPMKKKEKPAAKVKQDSRVEKVGSRVEKVGSRFEKVGSQVEKVGSRVEKVGSR
jgi:hypothetical protein